MLTNIPNAVYLFTNARDEPNIAEWIAHHLLLGFDKIFVIDHLSKVPIRTMLKTNFDDKVNIIRIDDDTIGLKLKFMKQAVNIAKTHNASWMLYLDADEFLNLNNHTNVKDYLLNFSQADSIGVNWLMFGSSGYIEQPTGLITENFIRSELRLNQHVKSLVRPSQVINIVSPHWFIIKNKHNYYTGNKTKMNKGPFNQQPLPFMNSLAYIAHYSCQSINEYNRRKCRQMDDGTGIRSPAVPIDANKLHNNITNKQLQYKYSQRTKDFLKQYNIVL